MGLLRSYQRKSSQYGNVSEDGASKTQQQAR